MARIKLYNQAKWGFEIKIKFGYTKEKLFFGITEWMTCNNSSATHAF